MQVPSYFPYLVRKRRPPCRAAALQAFSKPIFRDKTGATLELRALGDRVLEMLAAGLATFVADQNADRQPCVARRPVVLKVMHKARPALW